MDYKNIYFSGHATVQMFKREISVDEIISAIKNGKIINEYPKDKPYPSFLTLHFIKKRALHVVFSIDNNNDCIIITAYEPDENIWTNNFSIKKQ